MTGWIKLHRQLIDWEWYTDSHTLHVFIHCLLKANIEPGRFRGAEIPRGSFFTSILKISAETGISIKAVRLSLNKLKKTGEISFTGASDGTMITVCNYERYQSNDATEGQTKGVAKGVARGKQRASEGSNEGTTIKEYKNKEEEELKNEENTPTGGVSPDGKTETEKNYLHRDFIKAFTDWYEKRIGIQYKFTGGADGAAAKELIGYIRKAQIQKTGLVPADENILNGWKFILDSFDKWEPFHKQQLKLTQINSNLPNIMAAIMGVKNGKSVNYAEIGNQIREAYKNH